jgi:hypothetical protein
MESFRRIALLVTAAAFLGCSGDATKPVPLTQRSYQLVSIDGRSLPTTLFSGPIETYTIFDGSLILFSNDSSVEAEHARDSLPQYGVSEVHLTQQGHYRVDGDSIVTGFLGQCRDICVPNRVGHIDDSTVTLTYQEYPPDLPVYRYRLIAAP